MSIKKFDIEDHCNGVVNAIKKLGGVQEAADKLDVVWLEVQDWVKQGYVSNLYAQEIHNRTGVPMYELVQQRRSGRW